MEIEKMEAGRELDAIVAEQVFGMAWYRMNRRDTNVILRSPEQADRYWSAQPADTRILESADSYSTNLVDAWKVVELLKTRKLFISITGYAQRYEVAFGPESSSWLNHHAAPTIPLGICRAALSLLAHSNAQPHADE